MKKISLLHFLIGASLLGIIGGTFMGYLSSKKPLVQVPFIAPTISPYTTFIAGSGVVESPGQNIELGTSIAGLVKKVTVKPGALIKKGDVLLTIDERAERAFLKTQKANLKAAQDSIKEAQAKLKSAQDQYNLITKIVDKRAISKAELLKFQNDVIIAKTSVDHVKSLFDVAKAQLHAAQVNVNLCKILSPIDGEVLQVNTRPGQYASTGMSSPPLMLLGSKTHYDVRIDIDEADAWRFHKGAEATAYVRGNPLLSTKLTYAYTEPYILPKKNLNGDATEIVDTRVLQVVYSFDPKKLPVYIGQQVDVYIKADPIGPEVRYGGPLEKSK
ncbi:MAG: efflux RND transporter periplasmic adaptor subunit [Proteobacteria bacterium]|nr:efflux RND transporter periplasmic adaptor subunit [Pseudomonadota bacterium]